MGKFCEARGTKYPGSTQVTGVRGNSSFSTGFEQVYDCKVVGPSDALTLNPKKWRVACSRERLKDLDPRHLFFSQRDGRTKRSSSPFIPRKSGT